MTGPGGRLAVVVAAALALVAGLVAPTAQAEPRGRAPGPQLTGTVERVLLDDFGSNAPEVDAPLTYLRTATGAVKVPSPDLAGVRNGASVQVQLTSAPATLSAAPVDAAGSDPQAGADVAGVRVLADVVDGTVATGAGTAPVSAALAAGADAHEVLVVVADLPGDKPSARSAAQVAATVNGGVDRYWSTVSGGRVRFHATAYAGSSNGHITTRTAPCSNGSVGGSFDFWDEVAAKTHFVDGAGKHLLVYFNTAPDCGGVAGLATLGGGPSGGDLAGGGRVWSNGYDTVGVLGHELGHNLGLGHSQELRCGASVDGSLSSCTKLAYNDLADIMGVSWGNTGYLNAVHLEALGLLPPSDVVDVTTSRQVELRPLSSGSGVRVATLHDGGTTYLVEARAPLGTDSWLGSSYGRTGVTVRKVLDQGALTSQQRAAFPARESLLLDGDPGTNDKLTGPGNYRTVLPVRAWVPLAAGRLGIRVDSATSSGAVITLQVGGRTVATKAAGPSLSRPQANVRSGAVSRRGDLVSLRSAWSWTMTEPGAAKAKHRQQVSRVSAAKHKWRTTKYDATSRTADGRRITARGKVAARYLTESRARYSGGWSKARTSDALGGAEKRAKRAGARASLSVSGRSFGVVARTARHRGKIAIYVDGVLRATVSLSARRPSGPQVVWHTSFASSGRHVIEIVRVGKRTASFDGLVALR